MGVKLVSTRVLLAACCSILFLLCSADTDKDCPQPEFYGEHCNQSCSSCVDGVCSGGVCDKGCKMGLWGDNCEKACPQNCHACEQTEGFCMICHPPTEKPHYPNHYGSCYSYEPLGWEGEFSNTNSCETAGMYGPNCSKPCPEGCQKREGMQVAICDRFSGACLKEGCVSGKYYWRCDQLCNHLCSGKTCNRRTAECLDGCMEGWEGPWCGEEETDTGAIVGSIFGVLIALAIIAGVLYYVLVIRKRKAAQANYNAAPSS